MTSMQKLTFFIFGFFVLSGLYAFFGSLREYGNSKYNEGYAVAKAEFQQSAANTQTAILGAPKASRDDAEFINQVKNGDW